MPFFVHQNPLIVDTHQLLILFGLDRKTQHSKGASQRRGTFSRKDVGEQRLPYAESLETALYDRNKDSNNLGEPSERFPPRNAFPLDVVA